MTTLSSSIAYVSIGTAEFEAKNNTPLRLLPINGIAATSENVRNDSFPLTRELNFVTADVPVGMVKRFIVFAQSEIVEDLIHEHFFVPIAH